MDTEVQSHCEGLTLNTSTDQLPLKRGKNYQVACGYMPQVMKSRLYRIKKEILY